MMQQKDLDSKTIEILNIKKLIKERDEAKVSSNYVKSDALRDQLVKDYNIEIFDQKNGPSGWKYKDGRSKKLPNGMIIPDNLKVKRKRDDNDYSNDDVDGKGDSLTKTKNKQAVKYSNDGDVKSNDKQQQQQQSRVLIVEKKKVKALVGVDTDRNNSIIQKVLKTNNALSSSSSSSSSSINNNDNRSNNRNVQGVLIEDLKVGNGTIAKAGNRIKVHYLGKLMNGTTFDACLKKPFPFRLGKGEVIRGWDIGCEGMMIGGKRKLTIPPEKAYGKAGAPPTIPGNATLIFEVTLLEVA